MGLSADDRRARILEVVRDLGTIRVVDLASRIGLSAVTVRRDVAALSDSGLLHRSHGSVSSVAAGQAAASIPGRERTIGMLVPTLGSYFDEVIAGARAAAAQAGARLVLGVAAYESADDRAQTEQLLDSKVDGLLLSPNWRPDTSEDDCWIRDLPVPTVLVERRAGIGDAAAELDSVSSDHRHGVLLALRHLASLGHRSVLLAARDDTWTAQQVRAGYADAVLQLGLAPQPVIGIRRYGVDPDELAGQIYDAAAEGVRAVLVHNDQDAIQLPPPLRARGLDVPKDIALISYDDVFAALAAPALTAVAPPKRAVGEAALNLLLRRLDSGSSAIPVHHLELLPSLKVRASCGGEERAASPREESPTGKRQR
ncbi:substrate-binding domain-containing protein [Streptomyces sp. NPDC001037]|uniref:substrate-binding domain-containing protein n=1 Tax=Streptomyces sp. NPDC001037 TaxID=3364542 RepID=UPI0036AA8D44